ncbi:MAG: cyclic nucleotide-binding domain-containing protein [Bdellovibrionales bacterium]|nr:cyclic nucleotide-binding domain-containing protein [Bdellovibrionales bacterium]
MNPNKLKLIPLLAELPEDELQALGEIMIERSFPKSASVLQEDEHSTNLMFILDGKARVSLASNDGKEVVLSHLSRGDFFGEISLLTGEGRSADVSTLEPCKFAILSQEAFHSHIRSYPGLLLSLSRELALRLRDASSKIGDLALLDVYRRVARTLQGLATTEEREGKKIHFIEKRPTHQELAAMAGTSREMVTRALKGLEEDGCIVIDGKCIEILSLPA